MGFLKKELQPGLCESLQGQLLKGAECHIYLYCFTFVYIDLNRAFVIIVLFPKNYSSKKVCANVIGKWNALGIYWYNFYSFILIISATFFPVENFTLGKWDKFKLLKCFAENGFKN